MPAGEEDVITSVYLILLRQMHGSTIVFMLSFISFDCIADNRDSFVFKIWCDIGVVRGGDITVPCKLLV